MLGVYGLKGLSNPVWALTLNQPQRLIHSDGFRDPAGHLDCTSYCLNWFFGFMLCLLRIATRYGTKISFDIS